MDDIIFYQPPSTSSRQAPHLPRTPTASVASSGSSASISVGQTTQLIPPNEMWKDRFSKNRDFSDLSQERYSPAQHCRNNVVQEQRSLIATRYPPNSDGDDDYDDLPTIAELLSGINSNDVLASANSNGDDDDRFPDIDDLLIGLQQKSVSASAKPDSAGTAAKVDSEIRIDSPVDTSHSTKGSTQDPIVLSDDEFVGADSETDYSNLKVDPTKSDSSPLHVAESNLADGNGFGSGTTLISDHLVANRQNDENENDVIDGAEPQFAADRQKAASPSHGFVTHQARPLQVNTEITQGIANSVDLNVTNEAEDEVVDVLAKGDDNDDAVSRPTKGSGSSAVSRDNPVSDSNLSVSELQESQHSSVQSPRLCATVASLQSSNFENGSLPRYLRCKRTRASAPTRMASAATTVPTALKSTDLREPRSRTLITAPGQEREICNADQGIVDSGSMDGSNDKGHRDIHDTAGSKIGSRLRSRKRVRKAENIEDTDVEATTTHSPDVSCQVIAATSPGSMQESEEIPMHGYFTLKTIGSKVVYCLTFSQESLSRQDQGQRQDGPADREELRPVAPVTDPNNQWAICKIVDQKVVDDKKHYKVKWEDTWMPEFELAGARELIDGFEAQLRCVQGGSGEGRQKRLETEDHLAIRRSNARGKRITKKLRGRPRKEK